MGKRFITRIELDGVGRRWLAEYHKTHGMTQVAVLSRLVEWFGEQLKEVQLPILANRDANIDGKLATRIIRDFAEGNVRTAPDRVGRAPLRGAKSTFGRNGSKKSAGSRKRKK